MVLNTTIVGPQILQNEGIEGKGQIDEGIVVITAAAEAGVDLIVDQQHRPDEIA